MNEIFNPSLLISLGPSSKKALDFSKKLLSYLPKHFLNLIDYYNIESLENMSKDIQESIDTKLLSAKYLNALVDLGYKVRSENINSVKLNLYLFWDVYNAEQSAFDAVKVLSELNYGNIDREQYSGVSLFVIPIMEKEWILKEEDSQAAINKLKQIIDYISLKDNMISIDSKVYVLHCISNDGTRIPIEELEKICGIITYLNVLPSKDPPLSHFNKRLLMNEGDYKVGTIGITTLTVFKEKLLEDFSKYMAVDILNHASQYKADENHESCRAFHLTNYETQKRFLKRNINIIEENGCYRLGNIEKFNIKLPKNIAEYPKIFKNWEEYIENKCLIDIKKTVDKNSVLSIDETIESIDEDLRRIALNYSLKEAVNYISALEEQVIKQKPKDKSNINIDTSRLNRELSLRVNNYPNVIGYAAKCLILITFLIYSMINIVFPLLSTSLNIVVSIAFFCMFFILVYLDYTFSLKKLNAFIKEYKEEIIKKSGAVVNLYIEKTIVDYQKTILNYLSNKRQTLINCINNCEKASKDAVLVPLGDDENLGNLITDLLDFKDRRGFYVERSPKASDMYRKFFASLESYEGFNDENLPQKLLEFTLKAAPVYIDLDFFEYMDFKYKDSVGEELELWIDRSIVKSKYLLQYINNELLEEHSMFITSPQVYRTIRDMKSNSLSNFNISIIEGRDIYTNCISVVRLCLGVDLENITSIKKLKRRKEE